MALSNAEMVKPWKVWIVPYICKWSNQGSLNYIWICITDWSLRHVINDMDVLTNKEVNITLWQGMAVILFWHYYLIQTFIVYEVALGDSLCCQAIPLNNTESPYLFTITMLWYYLSLWQALKSKHMGNIMEKLNKISSVCILEGGS